MPFGLRWVLEPIQGGDFFPNPVLFLINERTNAALTRVMNGYMCVVAPLEALIQEPGFALRPQSVHGQRSIHVKYERSI